MTWRENIVANSAGGKPLRGSFRGAEFLVRIDDHEFGRRAQVHVYPKRDTAFVEDMGREAGAFQVEAFVSGDNYMADRDRLIAAINKPGPGPLVHPYYGALTVSVVRPRVRHSSRAGGQAEFTFTCIPSGALTVPTEVTDTAASVATQAEVARSASLADFVRRFAVDNLPDWAFTELEAELHRTLGGLTAAMGDVVGAIAAEIRAPFNMGSEILGTFDRVRTILTEPRDALRLYERMFDAGGDSPAVPATTQTREQQAQATDALQRLVRETAVIEAARAAAETAFAAADDALATRDRLLTAFDARLAAADPLTQEPIAADLFDALRDLRAAMIADLHNRGAQLPRLTRHVPRATLPARVLAYQLYGDADRADEIVTRNNIRHPGFVPGGKALEVLTDV